MKADRAALLARARVYARLMRIERPIGTFLLLWPALWALWIAAEGVPDGWILAVFALGVFLMRSAGCVVNDYADRAIDPHVARTKSRPFARGEVTTREALALFAALCLLAFLLVLTLNLLTILLSFVAVALAASYPFMKRYTYLPQIHLGMAFAWSVPMAFAAQTGAIPQEAWLLYIAAVLWTTAYDTMYAMVDRDDDIRIGVKSTAILFGEQDRLIIGLIQGLTFIVLLTAGSRFELGGAFTLGLLAAAGLAAWQQYLIRNREPAACFRAFLNNNWFGAAIFAGIALHYL
jgi:4-hydroxybenzoate polyprenyltransferase